MGIERLLNKGLLEQVEADRETALAMLDDSERHLNSAESIAESDPSGAFQLAYDAARKAAVAHMTSRGFRVPKGRPGGHETTTKYARSELPGADDALASFDRMRRDRNRSEYGVRAFGEQEVADALANARAITQAVRGALG